MRLTASFFCYYTRKTAGLIKHNNEINTEEQKNIDLDKICDMINSVIKDNLLFTEEHYVNS